MSVQKDAHGIIMYPALITKLKNRIHQIVTDAKLDLTHKKNPQGRPWKIANEEALTLALYQHASTRATKKSLYDDCKEFLNCSYKTLVVAINRAAIFAIKIIAIMMRLGKKYGHIVKATDATDLPVCLKKNADKHRVMKGLAEFGRSSQGWCYGLTMCSGPLSLDTDYTSILQYILSTPPVSRKIRMATCSMRNGSAYGYTPRRCSRRGL